MQINTSMTSSEVKRSRNLAEMKIRSRLRKKSSFCFRTDVFAFLRHEINRNDLDQNIYWNLWPFAVNFFWINNNEKWSRFENPTLTAPNAVMPPLSLYHARVAMVPRVASQSNQFQCDSTCISLDGKGASLTSVFAQHAVKGYCIWSDCSYPEHQLPGGLSFEQATVTV